MTVLGVGHAWYIPGPCEFSLHTHADSTFVDFARDLAPGIRVLPGAILWLDNVVFRRLTLTERRQPRRAPNVQASAVAAYPDSLLIFAVMPPPCRMNSRLL